MKEARHKRPHFLVILFIWNVQNRQIHRDRKISGCQELRGRNNGESLLKGMGFLGGRDDKCSKIRWWRQRNNSLNILKHHCLQGWKTLYINFKNPVNTKIPIAMNFWGKGLNIVLRIFFNHHVSKENWIFKRVKVDPYLTILNKKLTQNWLKA